MTGNRASSSAVQRSRRKGPEVRVVSLDGVQAEIGGHRSLLSYLEAKGKVELVSQAQQLTARNRYVTRGWTKQATAAEAGVPVSILDRWITLFGWEELRNKRLFERWQTLSGLRQRTSPNIEERVDRIFGGIESVAEQIIDEHMDGKRELDVKELSVLASAMKQTYEARRSIHGKPSSVEEKKIVVEGSVDMTMLHTIGQMIADVETPRQLIDTKSITVDSIEDAEFETLGDDD